MAITRKAALLFWGFLLASAQAQTSARDLYYKELAPESAGTGLRLQLRKMQGGKWMPVDPASVFRSGDQIRLDLESNRQAHLYVAAQGSDGRWSVLFPSTGTLETASRVFPNRAVFLEAQFDNRPGKETLHIALLAEPQIDQAKLIELIKSAPSSPAQKSRTGTLDRDLRYEAAAPAYEYSAFLVSQGKRLFTRIDLKHE